MLIACSQPLRTDVLQSACKQAGLPHSERISLPTAHLAVLLVTETYHTMLPAYLAVRVQAFEWLMFGSCAIIVLAAVVFTVYARAALARHTPRQLLGGWVFKPG